MLCTQWEKWLQKIPNPYKDALRDEWGVKWKVFIWGLRCHCQFLRPDSFNIENSQKPWKNAKSTILIFFQILEFQGNEVCFWYSFYHWSIVVLSFTLTFSKIGPTSGHNLEMGAWSQKLVIILYLVIVLWPNGTYGKAGGIFIRKLKFSTEFEENGKTWDQISQCV